MGFQWKKVEPEEVHMDAATLDGVDTYIKSHRYRLINSVVVVCQGKLIYEKYYHKTDTDKRLPLHSVTKSILSTLVGACLQHQIINSLETPVTDIFPHYFNNVKSPYHRLITLRTLLTMTSGFYWQQGVHYHEPMKSQVIHATNALEFLSEFHISDPPGTRFSYKGIDMMLLWAALEKLSGEKPYHLLRDLVYTPLGIESEPWEYTQYKSPSQAHMTARDMAKIGMVFLQGGTWEGHPLLPEWYAHEATQPYLEDYGYCWWITRRGFRAIGFGGQLIDVYPEKELVVVIQADESPSNKFYADIVTNVVLKAFFRSSP